MAGTNERLAREQCEKAFAAYIIAQKTSPPDWFDPTPLTDPVDVPVFIRKGQFNDQGEYLVDNPDDVPLPAVCIGCPRAKPHEGMDYPICELHVIVMNAADEVNAATVHSARFGFLAELLDVSRRGDVIAALNKPIGTDMREVQNFSVWGIIPMLEEGHEVDRRWVDHLVYEIHCVPTDDVAGAGVEPT